MTKTINTLIALLTFTVACDGGVQQHSHDNTTQEVSETRTQFEALFTECEDMGNTIELQYDDVFIVSATHWTNSHRREPVEGWSEEESTGRVVIAHCESAVQIVYMYK